MLAHHDFSQAQSFKLMSESLSLLKKHSHFEHCNFSECDFSDVSLSGKTFINCNFDNSKMLNLNLDKVNFKSSSFRASNLSGTDFNHAIFTECQLEKIECRNIKLSGAKFLNCQLRSIKFDQVGNQDARYMDWSHSHLKDCSFKFLDMSNSCLAHVEVIGCEFNFLKLIESDLSYIHFYETEPICNIDFSNANLSHACIKCRTIFNCHFKQTDLRNAEIYVFFELSSVKFSHANLTNAEFSSYAPHHVHLWDSDFSNANLTNVIFKKFIFTTSKMINANLTGIHFYDCALDNLRLSSSEKETNWEKCRVDYRTTLNFEDFTLFSMPNRKLLSQQFSLGRVSHHYQELKEKKSNFFEDELSNHFLFKFFALFHLVEESLLLPELAHLIALNLFQMELLSVSAEYNWHIIRCLIYNEDLWEKEGSASLLTLIEKIRRVDQNDRFRYLDRMKITIVIANQELKRIAEDKKNFSSLIYQSKRNPMEEEFCKSIIEGRVDEFAYQYKDRLFLESKVYLGIT